MNRKTFVLTVAFIAVILVSLFAALHWLNVPAEKPVIYVGVEVAYTNANVSDIRAMVNKVKDYTNVFVIGSVELTYNESALNESCNIIHEAGLKIIVLLTNFTNYSFDTRIWTSKAQQKYGDDFLALYRYDEPGGDQLDNPKLRFVNTTANYADTASNYTYILQQHVNFYRGNVSRIFTADYGLYWWDYKAGYDVMFAEFVGNQSRQRHIALCRGGATAFGRDWGAIITWKYDNAPYIENAIDLYTDLTTAYHAGAKYIIVFDYPKILSYGILTDDHLAALHNFWDYAKQNPQDFGSAKADVAYVVPKDYGFGFRSAEDSIWGIFPADNLSAKIFNDVSTLISQYGSKLDILVNSVELNAMKGNYSRLVYWNETVTSP